MPLIVLLGTSGQSRDIVDAVLAGGADIRGLLWDDAPAAKLYGVPVLGCLDDWKAHATPGVEFSVALGDAERRVTYGDAILAAGAELATVVHPKATVSAHALLGRGVAVLAGVQVSPSATIGDYTVLNANCSVDHDCVLERGVQFGPGVTLAGNVTVEAGAFVGVGASVMPGVRIGAGALVGAGAVVIRDVAPGATVAGNPAKPIG
jgi:sugar O-acyltransferase (sialic acid O-acetyltransferase NeuD family)